MSFLPNQPFRPFRPGEGKRSVFDSTRQNQAMDAIKRINRDLQRQLSSQPAEWNITEIFLGKIISTDYIDTTYNHQVDAMTDARYWVERQRIPETLEQDDLVEVESDERASEETAYVNATNLSETAAGSHGLEEDGDGIYLVFGITVEVRERKQVKAYYFQSGGSAFVRVKITGDATGGGKYTGRILTAPAALATATGDLAEADLGTVPSSDDALILNSREVGKSTHDLDSSGFLPLVFLGECLGTNADNQRVVVIDGQQWEDCE